MTDIEFIDQNKIGFFSSIGKKAITDEYLPSKNSFIL